MTQRDTEGMRTHREVVKRLQASHGESWSERLTEPWLWQGQSGLRRGQNVAMQVKAYPEMLRCGR